MNAIKKLSTLTKNQLDDNLENNTMTSGAILLQWEMSRGLVDAINESLSNAKKIIEDLHLQGTISFVFIILILI